MKIANMMVASFAALSLAACGGGRAELPAPRISLPTPPAELLERPQPLKGIPQGALERPESLKTIPVPDEDTESGEGKTLEEIPAQN